MSTTNTNTNTPNIYDAENKKAAADAKAKEEAAAIEKMAKNLQKIEDSKRIHAYLLAPYAQHSYSFQQKDNEGNASTQTKKGEKLFPLMELLENDTQADLVHSLSRLQGRLEMMFTVRANHSARRNEIETDAKVKLNNVFSILENKEENTHYNANTGDLETMYVLSFKKGSLKSGRRLSVVKPEALLETVIYCLWSKLVEKGYTMGMETQLPPPRPVEAKKNKMA